MAFKILSFAEIMIISYGLWFFVVINLDCCDVKAGGAPFIDD